MSRFSLVVSPEAEAETQEAVDYYRQEASRDLALDFLEKVQATLERISESPLQFPVVHRGVRRAIVKRFPYGVFFRLRGDFVKVIAIVHHARHPRVWKRRGRE